MSDIDLPEIPKGKRALLTLNMSNNQSLIPQFKTYLSNRLLEYFKKNPSQDPDITELSLHTKDDDFLANIFLSKDENGKRWYISDNNILKAVEEVINDSHASDAEKNADLIYILRVIIYVANVNDENGSSLPNQELQEYIDNWKKPTGGKKTRKYRKRKNKKSKTNKNKKRKTKKRARQIY